VTCNFSSKSDDAVAVADCRNEVMLLMLLQVERPPPNKEGRLAKKGTILPEALLDRDAAAAAALRVVLPKVAMENAVTATGPRRIAIAHAIIMQANERKEEGYL